MTYQPITQADLTAAKEWASDYVDGMLDEEQIDWLAAAFANHRAAPSAELVEALAIMDDALDMMFDGPDDGDREWAWKKWQRAKEKVKALASSASEALPSEGLAGEHIERLQKWKDDTPLYDGEDGRAEHYRRNRATLDAAIAALSQQDAMREACGVN